MAFKWYVHVCICYMFLRLLSFYTYIVLTKFLHELDSRANEALAVSDAKQKRKTPERKPRIEGSPHISNPPERPPKWTISKDWLKGA